MLPSVSRLHWVTEAGFRTSRKRSATSEINEIGHIRWRGVTGVPKSRRVSAVFGSTMVVAQRARGRLDYRVAAAREGRTTAARVHRYEPED